MQGLAGTQDPATITVRPLREGDLDVADHIMRVAFGTYLGAPDPVTVFGDASYVKTRFLAAPDCAWAAEVDGEVVGSNFATRWGSFAFFGPLTVRVDLQGRGIGSRLMQPVLEAFERWGLRQSGLFTFPESAKHIGLYQKHGFWPRCLNPVMSKPVDAPAVDVATYSGLDEPERPAMLQQARDLTDAVFAGLDLEREIRAVDAQALGDTILLHDDDGELVGLGICHCGGETEAGSGACFVKFAAVRPGAHAQDRFERLLDACERLAADAGLERIVAGVNTGRTEAYARMLARGYRTMLVGLAMRSGPHGPDYDQPQHYVIDDLR